MATDYYTGKDVRVGIALNAEVAGISFDGTPGAYDCMKLVRGGSFKVKHGCEVTPVEETGITSEDHETGGIIHEITVDLHMSYSYREKFFQLYFGGPAVTVGAAAPYTHTLDDLLHKVLNGSIFVEYAKQSAQPNQFIRDTYSNFVVTAASLKGPVQKFATLSVSGFSTGQVHSSTQASLSSTHPTERLSWKNFTPTLDGAATYRVGEFGFDLGAALAQGEFDHAAATPTAQDGNWYSGGISVKWAPNVRMNDASYSLSSTPGALWSGINRYAWDNGLAAGDNKQFIVTFGNSVIESPSETLGALGRVTQPMSLMAEDGSTPIIAVEFINSRAAV